jgi:hypothetical protein
MKRSIKLTKRIDIDKNNIILEGEQVEVGEGLFYPVINKIEFINENKFPSDARVFIRFRQNRNTRTFECGTVGNLIQSLPTDSFTDFIADKIDIKATFNVQDKSTTKILGSNKGFKYVFFEGYDGDSNSSVYQVAVSPFSMHFTDTGTRLWQIGEIDPLDKDVKILFNEKMDHREPIYKDPMIRNFILPIVFEKMLLAIINDEGLRDEDNLDTWPGKLNYMIEKYFPNAEDVIPEQDADESDKERFIASFIDEFMQKNRNILFDAALRKINEVFENE